MPGFADSFWSGDYAGGLGVLFDKLQQGIVENEQVITLARMRAEAEEIYGKKLADVVPTVDKMTGGFERDEGASLRKAYEGIRTEMGEAAKSHKKIASNILELVVIPFGRWCEAHESRVISSQDDLKGRMKVHDKQSEAVRKLRSTYFNKCRQVEDMEEESKLGFQAPEKTESSPKGKGPTAPVPEIVETEAEDQIEIGDEFYELSQVKKLLTNMLGSIKLGETKVAILGTYQNVSTGADIVDYIQKHMGATSVSYAERIGQDLVGHGLLRLVGNVGNTFANSSKLNYQWRPKAFQLTGIPEKKKLDRVGTISDTAESPTTIGTVGEMLQTWNPLNNPYPNETPMERMQREAREADDKYKAGVRRLDLLRCNLEEAVVDHLKFMERCELDRLKAIKSVMLDFSGALSNVIPSLQSTIDNMMLYQESVQPLGDLRYLIENYQTGGFMPKVQTYDNYYNNVDEQTFGVDLEARARQDRKRVPMIVTTILTFLDNHYPDLEGDEARRSIWTVEVPLAATHHLRNSINTGKAIPREILERYEIPIVASALKLYFLELPDSLVSSQVYEIMKTVYTSPDSSASPHTRVSVLQNTLGQLRLANIATLDAITTHFTRLIELTSADEAFVTLLAQTLAPCVLRPRTESSLTMHERYAYRLVRDLFEHKEAIFGELKRASSHSLAHEQRARAPSSSDEHNRRANMEARARAIASKSRATSPTPTALPNGRHRRDRSVGTAETRFPVVASPTRGSADPPGQRLRNSLGVPDDITSFPHPPDTTISTATADTSVQPFLENSNTNGISEHAVPASTVPEPTISPSAVTTSAGSVDEKPPNRFSTASIASVADNAEEKPHRRVSESSETAVGVQKKDSLGRTGHVAAAANRLNRKAPGSGSGSGLGMIARNAAMKRDSQGSVRDGKRDSQGSIRDSWRESAGSPNGEHERTHGVQLVDRPMDD